LSWREALDFTPAQAQATIYAVRRSEARRAMSDLATVSTASGTTPQDPVQSFNSLARRLQRQCR
jgi:hypothetical protein